MVPATLTEQDGLAARAEPDLMDKAPEAGAAAADSEVEALLPRASLKTAVF